MSLLALLSGKTASDEELLRQLNEAVLQLQVDALGKSEPFGLLPEDIRASREKVIQLLQMLRGFLAQPGELHFIIPKTAQEGALKDLVLRLEGRGRPRTDWIEDIDVAVGNLDRGRSLSDPEWMLLEDIIDLLDAELADDLRELSRQ